jgi:hypothetical protein
LSTLEEIYFNIPASYQKIERLLYFILGDNIEICSKERVCEGMTRFSWFRIGSSARFF